MNITSKHLHSLILLLVCINGYGQNVQTVITVSLPETENSKIYQTISYQVPRSFEAKVRLSCFMVTEKDSVSLYNLEFEQVKFRKGLGTTDLEFDKAHRNTGENNSFLDIVKNFDLVPPGSYRLFLTIESPDTINSFHKQFLLSVDSTLAYNSGIRNKINQALQTEPVTAVSKATNKNSSETPSPSEASRATRKIEHRLGKMKGVTTQLETVDGTSYSYLYYSGWFLGRYEIKGSKTLKGSIDREENLLKGNVSSLVSGNLENFAPVGEQMKKLNKKSKKEKDEESSGTIDLSSYFSNGQEPGSMQDNNYEELRGIFKTRVLDMPIEIEGYYTTQDARRRVKASYLRVHYDIEEQKSEMSGMINGYKGKYSEIAAKGQGMESIGTSYLNSLTAEKNKLLYDLGKNYGIDSNTLRANKGDLSKIVAQDTSKLISGAEGKVKSKTTEDTTLSKDAARLEKRQQDIKKKYERLVELEKQIEKYRTLLEQFRNQGYLDSAINYSKVAKLSDGDDVSYKQLAKAGEGLLPKGQVSKFVSGITHFDAGIINQYESDYTVAGQTIKGGSLGYDFNVVQVGVTAGKTEYVSRDGNLDRYSSYLARFNFKQFNKQKVSLIYYNYSPSRQMLNDDAFFKDKDIALPSFKDPVHVVSVTYDGTITKYLRIHSEGATSYKKTENSSFISADHGALKTALNCDIPHSSATVTGEWEHVGRDFHNSVLPYTNAATDRYTLAGNSDFFRNFLTVGLQYNYLRQASFSTTGYNTKWGFDLSTHSRRWPSLSISYKPYATFRTYTDTLNIPQRPLTGAVGIAKGTYQFKRNGLSHRFLVIYNQNSSVVDTDKYSSKMFQASYILSDKARMLNANIGWMQLPLSQPGGYIAHSSCFANLNAGASLLETLRLVLGEEVGVAYFGLQRTSTNVGVEYLLKKLLLSIRFQGRFTNYKADEFTANKNLVAGQLGINWQFKTNSIIKKRSQR